VSVLRSARLAVLNAAQSVGIYSAVAASRWRTERLMVLCYHGVSVTNEHEWSGLYVSQDHLRARLGRLSELRCNVLPLGEALERQRTGDLPPRAVAITFDDGAADFRTRAYPVLQEFGAPAMLYQTTWYVDREIPVFNTASSYLLWHAVGKEVMLPWRGTKVRVPSFGEDGAFSALHASLLEHVAREQLASDAQTALLAEIASACHVSLDEVFAERQLYLMTSAQLRELDPTLVDIQLHTHRHRTPRDKVLFLRELNDNAAALERMLQRPLSLKHFCYPSGVYFPEYADWMREYGMLSSTTCDPDITSVHTDRMFVPRLIDTMSTPDAVFDGWVTGAAAFLPRRR